MFLFCLLRRIEQIQRIDERLDGRLHDIGIGRKAVDEHLSATHLHVYAPHVVAALVHRLNQELGDLHRLVDQRLDRLDGRIDRSVPGAGRRALVAADLQNDRRGRNQRTGQYLQVFQLDPLGYLLARRRADQIEQVVVADILLFIGQIEKLGVPRRPDR